MYLLFILFIYSFYFIYFILLASPKKPNITKLKKGVGRDTTTAEANYSRPGETRKSKKY